MHPRDRLADDTLALSNLAKKLVDGIQNIDACPAQPGDAKAAAMLFAEPISEEGRGTAQALEGLLLSLASGYTATIGGRFFDLVCGGVTTAALGADWIVSAYDQNTAGRISSHLGTLAEECVIDSLLSILSLPKTWGGTFLPSATLANVSGLAAAFEAISESRGGDLRIDGMAALGEVKVVGSDYLHPSVLKALRILGVGAKHVTIVDRDANGSFDMMKFQRALQPGGILVGCAGEANSGQFDPLNEFADVAQKAGAWFHVDAAFGLWGRLTPHLERELGGVERADSVAFDAHKWLNVPYDSGIVFVKNMNLLRRVFQMGDAPYLSDLATPLHSYVNCSPEGSRRMRCVPVWASFAAYGVSGIRSMVERTISLAVHFAKSLVAEPGFEVLNVVRAPIICVGCIPSNGDRKQCDRLTTEVGMRINAEGHFAIGISNYRGRACLRFAFFSWTIQTLHIEELIHSLRKTRSLLDFNHKL